MKASLDLETRNFFLFFELEDFDPLINEETLEVYLYLITKDPRFIDRTKLSFKLASEVEILKKDIGLQNIFRNMVEYEQFQLLIEANFCKNNFTYCMTMAIDSFAKLCQNLNELDKQVAIRYLDNAYVVFSSEINNPENKKNFESLEKKWEIRFST